MPVIETLLVDAHNQPLNKQTIESALQFCESAGFVVTDIACARSMFRAARAVLQGVGTFLEAKSLGRSRGLVRADEQDVFRLFRVYRDYDEDILEIYSGDFMVVKVFNLHEN